MRREIAWIVCNVAILAIVGVIIISCASSRPLDGTAERKPYLPPPVAKPTPQRIVTVPAPPVPGVARSMAMVSVVLPTNLPVAKLPLAWDAVARASGYRLYLSHGNQQWYKIIDVGTNTTVNLTNFVAPLEIQVTAYDAALNETPLSSAVYYGAKTNGWPMVGNLAFIASPTNIYVLSNAPLIGGQWTRLARLTNVTGLQVVPLPDRMGRISLGIER